MFNQLLSKDGNTNTALYELQEKNYRLLIGFTVGRIQIFMHQQLFEKPLILDFNLLLWNLSTYLIVSLHFLKCVCYSIGNSSGSILVKRGLGRLLLHSVAFFLFFSSIFNENKHLYSTYYVAWPNCFRCMLTHLILKISL